MVHPYDRIFLTVKRDGCVLWYMNQADVQNDNPESVFRPFMFNGITDLSVDILFFYSAFCLSVSFCLPVVT